MATCLAGDVFHDAELAVVKADIAAGRIKYDPAKGGACVDWYERIYRTSSSCTQSGRATPWAIAGSDACEQLSDGDRRRGQPVLARGRVREQRHLPADRPGVHAAVLPGDLRRPAGPGPGRRRLHHAAAEPVLRDGQLLLRRVVGRVAGLHHALDGGGKRLRRRYACASPLFCDLRRHRPEWARAGARPRLAPRASTA